MLATSILKQIQSTGYVVSIHRVNGMIEMHAIKLDCTEQTQIARCADGNGYDEIYRCACLLASAVGIELEDG
jgi:hypothetical protein